jgi:hypothetical protein
LNDLLTSPLHPPSVIDPEINESRVKEINEAVVRAERLTEAKGSRSERLTEDKGSRRRASNLEARRQQAMKEIAEVGNMMAAKKKGRRRKFFTTFFFFLDKMNAL